MIKKFTFLLFIFGFISSAQAGEKFYKLFWAKIKNKKVVVDIITMPQKDMPKLNRLVQKYQSKHSNYDIIPDSEPLLPKRFKKGEE